MKCFQNDLLIGPKSSKTLKWLKQLLRLLSFALEDDLFKISFANEIFHVFIWELKQQTDVKLCEAHYARSQCRSIRAQP